MKTAVITGGNSGVGKAIAIGLAKKGYRVIVQGRDASKTAEAVKEIKKNSANNNVDHIIADISVVKGMKALVEAIKQKTNFIEAMVFSAGVILPHRVLTADGLETGFAIQYLSRFALTQLLLPELKKGMAKIVHVGAPVMKGATIFFDDIAMKNNFTMLKALAQEMFANHLFVQEFAKQNQGKELTMNIAHVGIAKTDILRNSNFLFRVLLNIIGKSAETASGNFIYLASDESVDFSGYFLKKPGNTVLKEKILYDPVLTGKLWNESMKLIQAIL
jgi:NAD(P)-dependent dehydrogenase (short-subunit alcohol dehydrogenase family)